MAVKLRRMPWADRGADQPGGPPREHAYAFGESMPHASSRPRRGGWSRRYTYDPYGRTLIEKCNQSTGLPVERLAASRFGNPFAWTGQRYDAGVKLYHFLHRSYSPRLGRWMQRDPLGYVDGVSLYEYVASQPTGWIDPLGLEIDEWFLWDPLRTTLEDARKETRTSGLETGGVVVVKRSGRAARRAIRKDATGKEMRGPNEVYVDYGSKTPYEQLVAVYHSHLNDTAFSPWDIDTFLNDRVGGKCDYDVLVTPNCVYVMKVTDSTKAEECRRNPAKWQKTYKDIYDKCMADKQPATSAPASSTSKPCNEGKTAEQECSEKAAAAVASKCGMKLYGGCGGQTKLQRIKP